MTPHELQKVVQYVTVQTSYSREDIFGILDTTFRELVSLAETSSDSFHRPHLVEYLTLWTIRQTGFPEPMIREILECAGRWLDDLCQSMDKHPPEFMEQTDL